MSIIPVRPGAESEVDDETQATLEDRLKTISRDSKSSEEWTTALKDGRIRQLSNLALK